MQKQTRSIMLFRRDLRLYDNQALSEAAKHTAMLPVFIQDTDKHTWSMGGASQWYLHHSLACLQEQLADEETTLTFFQASQKRNTLNILLALCEDNQCYDIYWNRRYEPHHIQQDIELKKSLSTHGITVHSFNNNLLSEPWQQFNKQGNPFKVFTPYWKHCTQRFHHDLIPPEPLPKPKLPSPSKWSVLDSVDLEDLCLLPSNPDWSIQIAETWTAGEHTAQHQWSSFQESAIHRYDDSRNIPSVSGTSLLSPHLAFGEISVRQIWHEAQQMRMQNDTTDIDRYLSEIGWREFSYYQLYHFPELPHQNFNARFNHFRWETNNRHLTAWQKGQTGYPLVDAGMRELWQTGYMHNRVRMIVASFLCKDLLIHWQEGAKWFWDTLLDADLASNSASWQWCAGCGADAAPFFRIFNPVLQSEKFDAQGHYIRQWVPELSKLPNKYIHKPWEAPSEILREADVSINITYPAPMVDHKIARINALDRYKDLKTLEE
ncbi:MAG: cryptochrome/photolyase family protein [Arenicella sp.]